MVGHDPKTIMKQINEAGIPTATAPAAENAENEKSNTDNHTSKVMVLAVHRNADGELAITPIDVEHEVDDQSDLSLYEKVIKKNLHRDYLANEAAMKTCLAVLFDVFNKRLYREQFRSFENFCFALYGTHRVGDALAAKARARVKKLVAEKEECE